MTWRWIDKRALLLLHDESLARNHPFADGNKRAAFLSIGVFLGLNGYRLQVSQPDATATILSLAAGELTQDELADWIRRCAVSR